MKSFLFTLAFLACCAAPAFAARDMEAMNFAVLRTIDKISARTRTFEVPVGKTVKFGNSLYIRVRACRQASPLDKPENAAFLQIWEKRPEDAKSHWVFSGWMFSSSPSLSAMEHPVYDVWVIACKNDTASPQEKFSSEHEPEGEPAKTKGDPADTSPKP